MGATPTPRNVEAPARVAVAFSGGRDSTALLHATCRAVRGRGIDVIALHVHHGLVADADAWVRHAHALCARWRRGGAPLQLQVSRLEGSPLPGESVEAWARRGRYAALAQMAHAAGAGLVLLAQHRRDQAETVLLQALRGAGPAGLAGMPKRSERAGLVWARPWLDQPREAIEAYLARHRLRALDDPSNADPRFARNRLRLQVWPVLHAAFPAAETAIAAVAHRAAEADAALDELAAMDLARCADARGLRVADWLALSSARRVNALRRWCCERLGAGPPQTLVARLCVELPDRTAARWPVPGAMLLLYRGRLSVSPPEPSPRDAPAVLGIDLSRPGRIPVPGWGGAWVVTTCRRGGVAADALRAVDLRARAGGERFALPPHGMPRSLKKQYQARELPAAARGGPLVWQGERLLVVPGLGIDARAVAPAGIVQRRLRWEPERAATPAQQPGLLQRSS